MNVAPLGGAPFRIGEELSYDLSVAGLFVGRMDMKVGKTRELDGQPALALFARARTNGLTSAIKSFQGRYMVLVEPESFRPVALRTEADYDGDARFEQAKFNPRRTGYNTHFKQDGVVRDRADQRPVALYDLLALLYHARRLPLRSGLAVCQEVYADKRLWRMEARVVGLVKVDTPSGRRSALHVTTRWDRLPHPDFDPSRPPPHAEVDLYFADDATRAPLAFDARTKEGAAHGALVRWVTEAGEGDASWSF